MKPIADLGIDLGEIELIETDTLRSQDTPIGLDAFLKLLAGIAKRIAIEPQADQSQPASN